ncbi:ribosome hibernation-promoting factor, HPF/YfiA family [Fuchsiella alkaliacetigena]|uniref:ribosome hibernation-promoting factor, HPF/YfiA family n=1 Tax=Fuchsiella alkaliacetigena TaxID=957042 RepID=UPI00200A46BC|nr:ribosome-associated translation inhibitor RaiA [Fuchsiella alkaliacetigena]MCK8824096.1 ribosome-associated translation inhibitor RaiA [Fuchsiella alkaliacetigena]
MKFIIRGKNIEITDALREYVEEKVGKLERYFDDVPAIEAHISLEVEKERHIVEVTVHIDGLMLRGEEVTGDMYASIDGVIDKLERQTRKYKTKINRKIHEQRRKLKKQGGRKADNDYMLDDDDAFEEPKIVRTKQFAMKPMPVEEAVMQMELLDHDFFVFFNAGTEEVNVVYKRKNGDYGLIEPTLN